MEEKNNEKKTVMEWLNEHPKTVFVTRVLAWAIFAAVLPFLFIAYRYGIFRSANAIAVSGWGIIGIVIVVVFCLSILSYIKQGMADGMTKQCVMGFAKIIIPLVAIMLIVQGVKENVGLFQKALGVTIACEIIAIPMNPFPEWLAKRKKEKMLEEQESMLGALRNKLSSKKGKNKE